jgi:hypothetical protein
MEFDKREMIQKLKLEMEVIQRGGYYPSVRAPRQEVRIFRDSVSCPNLGLADDRKQEPCTHCFLIQFVPPEYRDKDDACHYIPLNEQGDTVALLEAWGENQEHIQAAVLGWLRRTVAQLEQELSVAS